MTIQGDLLLGSGIGDGDAYIQNVTVTGTAKVEGGGANSIHFDNSVFVTVVVNKADNSIRIVLEGSSVIQEVVLHSGAKLEQSEDAVDGGFQAVTLSELLPENSTVELIGSFETVAVKSKSVKISIPAGVVKDLAVSSEAVETQIEVSKEAKIMDLVLDAVTKVIGEGVIDKATINVDGTSFEQKPQHTEIKDGVTATVGDEAVSSSPPAAPSSPPSSGGSQNIPVTAITVTGEGSVTSVVYGSTLQMVATITPANATNKAITWSVENGTGAAVISPSGLLTAEGMGTVTVKAVNEASGVSAVREITIVEYRREIVSYTPFPSIEIVADEHLVDLDALKASLKLPTEVTLSDGESFVNAVISDWSGDYDGTVASDYTLTAVWEMPSGYADQVDPLEVTIQVTVTAAQTSPPQVEFGTGSVSFTANTNTLAFTVTGGFLTGPLDTTKLKYATTLDGTYSYNLSDGYVQVGTFDPLTEGTYSYMDFGGGTTYIQLKLKEADANAIKALTGYGNDATSINDNHDRWIAEQSWYPGAATGNRFIVIYNTISILNESSHTIKSIHSFVSETKEYNSVGRSIGPNGTDSFNAISLTERIVFYAGGDYTPNVTPTSGYMKIVPLTPEVLTGGIILDDSDWIEVDETNFGRSE